MKKKKTVEAFELTDKCDMLIGLIVIVLYRLFFPPVIFWK